MNTHNCKVGTVRPNLNKGLNTTELKDKVIKLDIKKTDSRKKLSK